MDDWLPVWQKASAIKGQTLGLPSVAVQGWWFNKHLLEEQGVPSPARAGAPPRWTTASWRRWPPA